MKKDKDIKEVQYLLLPLNLANNKYATKEKQITTLYKMCPPAEC